MDALVLVFVSGLVAMFIAMLKKPVLVLTAAGIGLTGSILLLYRQLMGHESLLKWSYEGLNFDQPAILFSILVLIFGLLVVIGGYQHFSRETEHTGEYISLLLFSMVGAMCMLSFTDLFMFFIGLEILSIPIYVMVGTNKNDIKSTEASIKYFFTGAFATGILLFGIALLFGATGTFKLDIMHDAIVRGAAQGPLLHVGILFVLASFLFKIGGAPFHFWGPDVYAGSPNIVTGFMATVVKTAGLFAFFKMFAFVFHGAYQFWSDILFAVIILTMLVGNLSALNQIKFKRLLAYSSIANAGYALLVLLTASPSSLDNLWIYLAGYGLAVIALITVSVILNDEEDNISSFKGIGRKNPWIGFALVIGLLSLAGVPPLFGFFGKYVVFFSAFQLYPILVIIAVINSGIGIYYYLKLLMLAMSEGDENSDIPTLKPTNLQILSLAICTIGLLTGGLIQLIP
jgi:NADH-quinone oxidoreductase subunit N